MKKSFLVISVLIIVLAFLLSGCAPETSPEPMHVLRSASVPSAIAPVTEIEASLSNRETVLMNADNKVLTISFIFGDRTGIYTGALLNGVPSGYGVFITDNSEGVKWSYTGFFEDGEFNGNGEIFWESGARREGIYKNGSLIDGRIYNDDGILLFEGELGEQEEHTEEFIHFPENLEDPDESSASDEFIRNLSVHFIDAGQADSILILLPNGENMLIDGGESHNAAEIIEYLQSFDVTVIDYLIASHPHSDHIGGLPAIIDATDVLRVYMPRVSHNTVAFENLLLSIHNNEIKIDAAIAGLNVLAVSGLSIDIIGPERDDYNDHNNHSAVLKLIYGNTSFLFMGDAEASSESHIRSDVSADVIKIGHHGSKSSTTDLFLHRVNPSYAVISVGADNQYGHPADEVLSRLNNADIKVYRTDKVGTIVFTSDGENIITDKTPSPYQPDDKG